MGRRYWIFPAVALLMVQLACAPRELSEADTAAVSEEVSGFVGSLFEAMNDHDVDAIADHYDGSPEFIYVGCTSVRVGFQSLEQVMRMWNRANEDVTFDPEILGTRVLDRDAAAVVVRAVTSDESMLFWTFVVERGADGWRIAHEHESWSDCPTGQMPHPGMEEMMGGGAVPGALPEAGDSSSAGSGAGTATDGVDGGEAGGS